MKITWEKAFQAVLSLAIGLLLVFVNDMRTNIKDYGDRLSAVEKSLVRVDTTRFTASDGLEVWKEIAKIRENIAKLPTETPPKWFIDRVDKLEQQVKDNNTLMLEHMESAEK